MAHSVIGGLILSIGDSGRANTRVLSDMESMGACWRPVYGAIEEFHSDYRSLMVVNAHHMRILLEEKSNEL